MLAQCGRKRHHRCRQVSVRLNRAHPTVVNCCCHYSLRYRPCTGLGAPLGRTARERPAAARQPDTAPPNDNSAIS